MVSISLDACRRFRLILAWAQHYSGRAKLNSLGRDRNTHADSEYPWTCPHSLRSAPRYPFQFIRRLQAWRRQFSTCLSPGIPKRTCSYLHTHTHTHKLWGIHVLCASCMKALNQDRSNFTNKYCHLQCINVKLMLMPFPAHKWFRDSTTTTWELLYYIFSN